MIDLMLLATPVFLGWCVSIPLEALFDIDTDVRWNHPLASANPRRFRPPPCGALEDLEGFEWEWGSVCAAISAKESTQKKEEACANG